MRIGVDAGGTFTDFVALHDDGRIESFKLRSNPREPARVILEGIGRIAGTRGAEVVHGSTVATNALLERKGARTAFVTTAGFEDILHIGRQNRRELYNLTPHPPPPLVPRELCFGIRERTFFDGTIERRASRLELRRLRDRLKRAGVESVAVCFLHSYRNPANELAALRELRGCGYLCLSCEVSPEFREYERGSTTAINAYVGPLMDAYLTGLERSRRHRLWIVQSNGGFLPARIARKHAVRTVLSGPAGGVVGALESGRMAGFRKVLGFDMGGTSTDVSLCDGAPRETLEARIDGLPVRVPMLDIDTVGAGGGSIARVDAGGLLRVGPESAGAEPGPACYGVGAEATVTDAHVVLGRIKAEQFLGGQMRIAEERSAAAVDRIARRLSLSRLAAAEGILRVANANMERAIRAVSVERGHDPRDFALVAFGGGGGLHACELAEALDIRAVVVPRLAEALSALGMLLSDQVRDFSAGVLGARDFEARFRKLERRALREMGGAELSRAADLRYAGQSYELMLPWNPADPGEPFHREHLRVYGYSDPGRNVEVVTLRVRARIRTVKPQLPPLERTPRTRAPRRAVCLRGRWVEMPAWRRGELPARPQRGPALVLDYGTTTLVLPGWSFRLDAAGHLILMRSGSR